LDYSASDLQFIKMHMQSHYVEQIKLFGSPKGTTTNFGELKHNSFIKLPYQMTNKKNEQLQVNQNIKFLFPIFIIS